MRRFRGLLSGLAAIGVLSGATAATAVAEEPPAWTVNGVPLASGETRPAKFSARTPITLRVPDLQLTMACQKLSAKGTLEGGEPGAISFAKPAKLSKCTGSQGATGTPVGGYIVIDIPIKCRTDGDWYNPFSWTYGICHITIELNLIGGSAASARKHILSGEGTLDTIFVEGGILQMPDPPLSSTGLTIEGHEAIMSGEELIALPKHAVLSGGHL